MYTTKQQYEVFFREICEWYMGAEMVGDEEMMNRLARARILFKYNNMDDIDNMTFKEIREAVIAQDVQTVIDDFKSHFRNKED